MKNGVWKKLLYMILCCIAAAYVFVLLRIVLFKYGLTSEFRQIQYVPFAFIKDFLHPMTSVDVLLKNVLGNFAIFFPLGLLLPALFRRLTFGKTVLIGFLTSLGFELIQLAIGCGLTDIDDLILNTLGCLAGAGLYFGLFYRKGKWLRARLLAVCALIAFGCCGLVALWLYQPGLLPRRTAYENEELLGGVDRDSYDVSAVSTGIEDGVLRLTEYTPDSYPLRQDARILFERHRYQFSPNGNIQKTTVIYEEATPETAAAAFRDIGNLCVDIWLDADGTCQTLIVSIL